MKMKARRVVAVSALLAAVVCAALVAMTATREAEAVNLAFTTFTVDRTDDVASATACTAAPNDCSLRGAVIKANTTAGTDTIIVPEGTYTLTIPGVGEEAAATGDLDLTETVTIQGAGAETTIIQAGTTSPVAPSTCADCIDRVFQVVSSGVIAEFIHLTIRHGSEGFTGGGIFNLGTVMLTNSTLSNNRAGSTGGGIYNSGAGNVTINNSTLSHNTASEAGGGILISDIAGTVTITSSTVSNNSSGFGGGIASAGTLGVTNSNISGNLAAVDGGGINNGNAAGNVTITNSTLSNNVAAKRLGGGISNFGTLVVTSSTLSGNDAVLGAGIGGSGTATITNSTLSNNSGGAAAGAIAND